MQKNSVIIPPESIELSKPLPCGFCILTKKKCCKKFKSGKRCKSCPGKKK